MTYSACHEAGHALARAKNGDAILLIDAIERFVSFRTPDWKCGCGGYLHRQGSGGVVFNFNPDCNNCDQYVIKLLAANYVGSTATAMLMPEDHDPQDAECDYAAAAEFRSPYKDIPEKWKALKLSALEKAEDLVRISAVTILKLRDATVAAGGRLDGPRAHEVIDSQTKMGN